jgi:transposase-like protein
MSKSASVLPINPDAEAEPRLARRTFTAEYKAKILAECDAADQPGQIGAILRREGLYSSHLADWRKRRAEAGPRRIGRPPVGPAVLEQRKELERMKRENAKLSEKLRKAEIIIDAQKKLAEVLSSLRTASGNSE